MPIVTLVLQGITAVCAFVAAVRWYQAANVVEPDFTVIGSYGPQLGQIAPISRWAATSADLSRAAARWACASAVAGGLNSPAPLLYVL